MKKIRIAKNLAFIVGLGGVIVMVGWFMDIDALKSILPIWVTMKFTTALSFFLSGITLYFVARRLENRSDSAQIILSITTLIILLLMATLLISVVLNIKTGVEDLFVREQPNAFATTVSGRPSIGTMVNFIFVAIIGILSMFETKNLELKIRRIGIIITSIGSIAILFYLFSKPLLYFGFKDINTAMAFHTALLFILTGIGFILLKKQTYKED